MASTKKNRPSAETPTDTQDAQDAQDPQTNEEQTAQETAKPAVATKLTPIGKITVASVYGAIAIKNLPPLFIGTIDDPQPNPNKELKICRIAGFASGTKSGVTQYGTWTALAGEFAATNYDTGEVFASKTTLIPGAMGEALTTAMDNLLADNPDGAPKLRFSVDISLTRSPREPDKKYVYVVRPVIEAELSSPALALLSM